MNATTLIATRIVKTLQNEGFVAYFAGGWVRDHLLGKESVEVDIATSAPPEKIASLFPKTIPVGIAFGVVVVVLEGHHFEVTTFRKDLDYQDGRHPSSVDFSTPEKDAMRRDFTINGMFFDPLTQEIHDYVGGREDLKKGIIRAIGNPQERFQEDRLRMIRAIRFAARFGFTIEKETFDAIKKYASTLFPVVSIERIWQEWTKICGQPNFDQALLLLEESGLLSVLFPEAKNVKDVAKFIPYFPSNTPAIVFLLQLFPEMSLEKRLLLCRTLKTSLAEIKLVEFFTQAEELFKKEPTKSEWVQFYAHKDSPLFLEIVGAKLFPPEREKFHKEHKRRERELSPHIERAKERRTLLTSTHLQHEGVKPGKLMGELLKEGERLAIEEDLKDHQLVLARLKKGQFWPS